MKDDDDAWLMWQQEEYDRKKYGPPPTYEEHATIKAKDICVGMMLRCGQGWAEVLAVADNAHLAGHIEATIHNGDGYEHRVYRHCWDVEVIPASDEFEDWLALAPVRQ